MNGPHNEGRRSLRVELKPSMAVQVETQLLSRSSFRLRSEMASWKISSSLPEFSSKMAPVE
ncbi:hypothetical protein EYF80_020118 [Liparis tanakae]|uniref:Uncharacterized protein n=1 Tax=Liparis tanakae TaxID=230148 RepID=A0A4Z2HVD2_9TELE|nr:hypothetical protein EYF80_020118 [Liparis tanakae]